MSGTTSTDAMPRKVGRPRNKPEDKEIIEENKYDDPDKTDGVIDWKTRLDDDYSSSKTMSPSAASSDCSVIQGRFDSEEFFVGQKIEVQDYRTDTWYPAKIVEVDYDDGEVFIHYERWSVKFDEWLKWDSQRIRRVSVAQNHNRFKVGEHVLATWSYTKKYPAAVKSILPDDKYEVLFFDGFVKVLKSNRISKIDPRNFDLLEKMPKDIPRAPPIGTDLDVRNIGTKEERRQKKRRLSVAEFLTSNKRRKTEAEHSTSPSISADLKPTAVDTPEVPPVHKKRGRKRKDRSLVEDKLSLEKEQSPHNIPSRRNSSSREVADDCDKEIKSKFFEDPHKFIKKEESLKKYKTDEKLKTDLNREKTYDVSEKDPELDKKFNDFSVKSSEFKINSRVNPGTFNAGSKHIDKSIRSPSKSSSNMEAGRRISKRGRIPKMKTSLGSFMSNTSRMSVFPKIKPRGQVFKPNENKTRGPQPKKRNLFDSSEKIKPDNLLLEKEYSDKKPQSEKELKPFETKVEMTEEKVKNKMDFDPSSIKIEPTDSSHSTSICSEAVTDKNDGQSIEELNVTSNQIQPAEPYFFGEHVKKRGRRSKKFLKKLDEKRKKALKIARKKTDEDDDPERWSGDIPEGAKPVFIDGGDGTMRQSIIIPDKKLPPGWSKHTIIRKNSSKWDVLLVNANGRKFRSRKDLRAYYNELNADYPEDCFDFVIGRTKLTSSLIEMETLAKKGVPSPSTSKFQNKKRDDSFSMASIGAEGSEKRVKTLMPKSKPSVPAPPNQDESIVSAAAAALAASAVTTSVKSSIITPPSNSLHSTHSHSSSKTAPYTPATLTRSPAGGDTPGSVLSSYLTPDSDTAASWLCPKESCGKHFRKENLLQMHIKHYHPEYNQFLDSAPNVADLAYARTIGEPLDEMFGTVSYLDKINKYEARRKTKGDIGTPTSTGLPKKSTQYSSLRKALIKGIPKDATEFAGDVGDYSKPNSPAGLSTTKYGDAIDHGDGLDMDSEQSYDNWPKAQRRTDGQEYSQQTSNSTGHSTLKELLTASSFDEHPPNRPSTPLSSTRNSLVSNSSSLRFSRSKPLVALEKLNVTTDSNGRIILDNHMLSKSSEVVRKDSIPDVNEDSGEGGLLTVDGEPEETLRKDEIINCPCGYLEEDGLMIQCDLCLCWQHGYCNNIKQDSDVPEKYICVICRNPKKLRNSCKFSYNFDWLKEGKLPSLSFRKKSLNRILQRESLLKRSHDLVATLLQIQKIVKSLRLKTHIAGRTDHPKLYLWAKSWEKEAKVDSKGVATENNSRNEYIRDEKIGEDKIKEDIEQTDISAVPQAPIPEAPIDMVECRLRLLEHIEDYQLQIESRLTTLESQIVALESQDPDLARDESSDRYPETNQTVQMLIRDLSIVRKAILLN